MSEDNHGAGRGEDNHSSAKRSGEDHHGAQRGEDNAPIQRPAPRPAAPQATAPPQAQPAPESALPSGDRLRALRAEVESLESKADAAEESNLLARKQAAEERLRLSQATPPAAPPKPGRR